jgi:hypothetical protein
MAAVLVQLERHRGGPRIRGGTFLRRPAPQYQSADPCTTAAVAAAGSLDRDAIAAKMQELPVNDAFVSNGRVRADGLMQHDIYLLHSAGGEHQ